MPDPVSHSEQEKPLTLLQTARSVFSAVFGVQRQQVRERDFSRGKLSHFVIVGIAFALIFVVTIWGIVKVVMHLAGV